MCGRFAFYSPHEAVQRFFGIDDPPLPRPARWNIAPGGDIVVVRVAADGQRSLVAMHWGLVPSWTRARDGRARLINARAETLAEKPSFRAAFRRRRCLVPADGYYEWRQEPHGKQPYLIQAQDGVPFGMAALWESWRDPVSGEPLTSCAIITCAATGAVQHIHERMPVVLAPTDFAPWLDPAATDPAAPTALLAAPSGVALRAVPVSRRVNSPRNDDPELLLPAAPSASPA